MSSLIDLQLRSNVKLAYDYCFSTKAQWAFLRMYHTSYLASRDIARRDMFAQLERAGVATVPNGTVEDLLRRRDPALGVVVYVDESAHMGQGKVWLSAKEALERFPKAWCSEFVAPAGRAVRHFQFGSRCFTLPFQSGGDWRCQVGKGSYSYAAPGSRHAHLFPVAIPYPYWAIDFVPGTDMATDFQFVPGTTDDRLDHWMSPREMYQALQEGASILIERGLARGDQERGFGLVRVADLVDEPAWLARIGRHPGYSMEP